MSLLLIVGEVLNAPPRRGVFSQVPPTVRRSKAEAEIGRRIGDERGKPEVFKITVA